MSAARRIVNITLDNLDDLPRRCRTCVFWELDPVSRSRAEEGGDTAFEKEAWVSATLLEWGSCGKIAYVEGAPAAYIMFAPPAYVPRSVAFPTSPVSADAVLMTTAYVIEEFTGGGLGRVLVQSVAKDLIRRNVRAIEAFGDAQWQGQGQAPSGGAGPAPVAGPGAAATWQAGHCVVPADYLLAVGFKTVRAHHRWPRLRLELKTAVSWREDVEVALERLLGSMSPEGLLRPVGGRV